MPQPVLSNIIIDAPSPIAPKLEGNAFFLEDSNIKIEDSEQKNRKNGVTIDESNPLLNESEVSFLRASVRESVEMPLSIP